MYKNLPYYTEKMPKTGDIEYINERCKLDIYCPALQLKNLPVIIWFHGGGLSEGEKFIPETLKNRDVLVVAPNYRLSGNRAKTPDYLFDAAAAVKYTKDNIEKYGGDSENIYITGGSAGGWLALMLAMDYQYLKKFDLSPKDFRFMPISSATSDGIGVVMEKLSKKDFSEINKIHPTISEYAPLYHIKDNAPEIEMFVGDPELDWPGRVEENMLFVQLMKRMKGNNIKLYTLFGFNHNNVYAPAMILILEKVHQQTLSERIKKLPPPPNIKYSSEIIHNLLGRFGQEAKQKSDFKVYKESKNIIFEIINYGNDDDIVALSKFDNEKYIYQGDCVELFLAPAEDCLDALQITVDPNGKKTIKILGNFKPNINNIEICSIREYDNWKIKIKLNKNILQNNNAEILFNIYRHFPFSEDGRSAYSNFSPTGEAKNYVIKRFAKLKDC